MKNSVRAVLDTAVRRSPAQVVFRWRAARRLTILAYHGIEDDSRFEVQLDYLLRTTFPVSLDDVIGALQGRHKLPQRAVLLTFDDGERSVLDRGAPLTRARGVPGVAFVVAGLLDTDEPFWWSEVSDLVRRGATPSGLTRRTPEQAVRWLKTVPDHRRRAIIDEMRRVAPGSPVRTQQLRRDELHELESAGIMIGNHSLTHPIFSRCDDESVENEIHESHRLLTEILGRPPRAFAYPDGDCPDRVRTLTAEAGYEAAFLFDHRISRSVPTDALRISRARVSSATSLDRFAAITSGLHPAIHHVLGRS